MRTKNTMVQLVLLHVLGLLILNNFGTLSLACPTECNCRSGTNVSCSQIKIRWIEILEALPSNTEALEISQSVIEDFAIEPRKSLQELSFPYLKNVHLSHSKLGTIARETFLPFKNMSVLHLDNNNISTIKSFSLASLPELKVLNLSHNQITKLDNTTFQKVEKLKVLILAHNNIGVLPADVFTPLSRIEYIDLSSNDITYIHPKTFQDLKRLQKLHLQNNRLETLHVSTFYNMTVAHVELGGNHWDCDCGIYWLTEALEARHPSVQYIHDHHKLMCMSPMHLRYRSLMNVSKDIPPCVVPKIQYAPSSKQYYRLHNVMLNCNATGHPKPSVYWITPIGVLALEKKRKWINPDIVHFRESHRVTAMQTYRESRISVMDNGSLYIEKVRFYFNGEYQCVAENPGGLVSVAFNVTITTNIQQTLRYAMFVGNALAGTFAFLAIVCGLLKMCILSIMKKRYLKKHPEDIETSICSEDISNSSMPLYWPPPRFTPYDSPLKCVTPEAVLWNEDGSNESPESHANIRETLEDVRERLRVGVERNVERIRTRAAHIRYTSNERLQSIRESSTQYIHNVERHVGKIKTRAANIRDNSNVRLQSIRESSSQYIHTLRSSSSSYVTRVRAGVVLGVEQVKYHVQSIKELCGTGDIGQTISTISVATDVDSQKTTGIVRKTTLI